MTTIGVTGSRSIRECEELTALLDELQPDGVVTGGAEGVDELAAEWAKQNGRKLTVLRPDYAAHGKAAPMVRNAQIVQMADAVVAVWDGQSKGTEATTKMAQKAGKLLTTIRPTTADSQAAQLTLW
jgi:predicted Rossmann-fold nucleotide-binding protein